MKYRYAQRLLRKVREGNMKEYYFLPQFRFAWKIYQNYQNMKEV